VPVPRTRVVKLKRLRIVPDQSSRTTAFLFEGGVRSGNARCSFIRPENALHFTGEEAWCEVERVPGVPWAYWRVVRVIEVVG
jgi:hypothetical protein